MGAWHRVEYLVGMLAPRGTIADLSRVDGDGDAPAAEAPPAVTPASTSRWANAAAVRRDAPVW